MQHKGTSRKNNDITKKDNNSKENKNKNKNNKSETFSTLESLPLISSNRNVTRYEGGGGEGVSTTDTTNIVNICRQYLYASHFFAQFSDVCWQFCLVLFLAAFTNYKSLLLVSTYGLTSGLTVCIFGSTAGRFIDNSDRLFVAQRFIWIQNLFVLLATLFCYLLLSRNYATNDNDDSDITRAVSLLPRWLSSRLNGLPVEDTYSITLLIGIHICGSVADILNQGFLVAMERDWIVVMAKKFAATTKQKDNDENNTSMNDEKERRWLSNTNITMKQIDLGCKVCAPAVAGFVIAAFQTTTTSNDSSFNTKEQYNNHGKDLRGAAVLVGLTNIVSLLVEYACTSFIYYNIPELNKKQQQQSGREEEEQKTQEEGRKTSLPSSTASNYDEVKEGSRDVGCGLFFLLPDGLQIYMGQSSICWAGIGFALLYLNVLTFGALMTTYLVWRGMQFSTVGIWRGVSAAVGLLGTVVYHYSTKYLSIESTGMWSIIFQFTSLSIAYTSLFLEEHYLTSLAMLIGGVCLSRVGLWVFDISITQLMQERIPESIRGVTGGVQKSLNAFFGLLAFVLGILFPSPEDFYIYVSAGYSSVAIALILYTFSIFLTYKRENTTTTNQQYRYQQEELRV